MVAAATESMKASARPTRRPLRPQSLCLTQPTTSKPHFLTIIDPVCATPDHTLCRVCNIVERMVCRVIRKLGYDVQL